MLGRGVREDLSPRPVHRHVAYEHLRTDPDARRLPCMDDGGKLRGQAQRCTPEFPGHIPDDLKESRVAIS